VGACPCIFFQSAATIRRRLQGRMETRKEVVSTVEVLERGRGKSTTKILLNLGKGAALRGGGTQGREKNTTRLAPEKRGTRKKRTGSAPRIYSEERVPGARP